MNVLRMRSALPGEQSDAELAAQARHDSVAFGQLYDRYVALIYRYCLVRLRDRDEAEDATSVVFARALAALPSHRGPSFRFVLDGRRDDVQEFTPDGTFLRSFDVHPGAEPLPSTTVDVAVDAAGNVYVTELTIGEVLAFDASGKQIAALGAGEFGGEPQSLEIDRAGRIFVGDGPPGNQVLVFTLQGELLSSWGGFGTGDGQFVYLLGIALDDDGHAYVGDYNADRVQKFQLLPPLAAE